MKASEFIGKVVIDPKGLEIGKIADIIVKPEECLIDRVIISSGGVLSKKYLSVTEKEIDAIGDYIIITLSQEEAGERLGQEDFDSVKKVALNFQKLIGKTVITQNGVELGTVEDMIVKPKECLIENVIIKSKSDLGRKTFMVGEGEIIDIKDFMVLKLDLDDIEDRLI
ncbi:PRC-barrel domain-containing protein [Methanobacterium alcaliphilum]|uniref:PRC-barrel domain-containing protein n=1 Tax=Methanobacterium alcaliphilum TaxID=392018 RepID=UPI00200A7D91|nr:PRC-barrel domain-containing protein [Methanobacterium alcaliphilum]MCK9151185.1 PRC-barrel domain-containing protein [Methanobacterium alcaliphilum]